MKKKLLFILLHTCLNSQAQCWKTVLVGERHSAGIQTDGTLWGWGYNGDGGVVGNGSIEDILSPVQLSPDTDWKQISAGQASCFGIKESGLLWAWGSNYYGNLGTGNTITPTTPIQIGNSTWKMVKAAKTHTVGIKSDGTLWAWGSNQDGNIGDGTFINRHLPTQISTATNWKMVNCNISRSIAIKEDGTLWVWGFNSPPLGISGSGSNIQNITVPTQLGTDTDWKIAVAGFGHYLALKNDNTLWAWGGGSNGKLGNGSTTGFFGPTQIGTATDWEMIETDTFSSFGIKTDGSLWAWGENQWGNLGDGTQNDLLVPTQITSSNDWKEVSTSYNSSSGLKIDGSLYSWGSNYWGNLGNGSYTHSFTPEVITTCLLATTPFDKNNLTIYPNPFNDTLNISDSTDVNSITVVDMLGRVSKSITKVAATINLSDLTSGMYLVTLYKKDGSKQTFKTIKN